MSELRLYGTTTSGNCWKAAQILALTGHAFEWVITDGNAGATRTPEFLALNPIGKVPAVVLGDGTVLVESNAILLHFGEGSAWLPPPGLSHPGLSHPGLSHPGLVRTRIHEWLFFEQYSHEPYIAVARNIISWRREAALNAARLADCAVRGAMALDVMQHRLASHAFLAGDAPSIADLALFAYTHRADEGEFDLARWPGVRDWVTRIAALPGITLLPRPG